MGVVGIIEDHFVADADELPAEGSSEVLLGEHLCRWPDGYRGCVKEKDLLAPPGIVEAVGGDHDRASGGEFLVDDVEDE